MCIECVYMYSTPTEVITRTLKSRQVMENNKQC